MIKDGLEKRQTRRRRERDREGERERETILIRFLQCDHWPSS